MTLAGRLATECPPAVDARMPSTTLRLQVVSDLAGASRAQDFVPDAGVDVVVAAGDVTDSAVDTFRWLRDRFPAPMPIIAVLGDREFRGSAHRRVLNHARRMARACRVTLLENDAAVVRGVRFVGATLWTDFRLHGDAATRTAQEAAEPVFADLDIGSADEPRLDPLRSTGLHWWSRTGLGLALATSHEGPTVVVTHHAPTGFGLSSVPFLNPLAPAHASRCDDLVRQSGAALWIHGGLVAVDHVVGGTRVISRPLRGGRPVEVSIGVGAGGGSDVQARSRPAPGNQCRAGRSRSPGCLRASIQASLFDVDDDDGAERRTARVSTMPPKLRRAAPSLDAVNAARLLDAHADYRVLRRLKPRRIEPDYQPRVGEGVALLVDVETTGLDHSTHEVIEIGMVAFVHDAEGRIGPVVGVLGMLQEPKGEISPEIVRLTGITSEMVAGQRIDLGAVRSLLGRADLVIAHNAKFDRPFCERLDDGFRDKAWACSVAEVPWRGIGFEGAKLGYLVNGCGWFHQGHRAVDDCHALLGVLAHEPRDGTGPVFGHLLRSSRAKRVRIWAERAPFDRKDLLKARGYRWSNGGDGQPKAWWTEVDEEGLPKEMRFLEREVYRREVDLRHDVSTAYERHRAA